MPAQVLLQFCQLIEIDVATVKEGESPWSYNLSADLPAGTLKHISEYNLKNLVEFFGDSLTFRVGIPQSPLLEIVKGNIITKLDDAVENIAKRDDDLELRLDLSLNKSSILKRYKLDSDQYNAIFYLFKDNLIKFLRSPLPNLDKNLFIGRNLPTIIIVSDTSIHYSGPFLTVVGVDNHLVKDKFSPINQKRQDWAEKYYTTALDRLSWVGFELKNLTPLHFLCNRLDGNANELDSIISNHLLHLSILYTANRASYDNNHFQASFSSSDRTVTITLDENEVQDEPKLLRRLAIWPYGGKETDRLIIFQNVVARELESGDQKDNYKSFVGQLRHLLDEARWHYRIFLDGQIDGHFEQVQMATNYVAEMSREVSKSIESVTKGLTDALLATIGVIVLTLLASLTKSEMQGDIFRYGMMAYAAYLFLFQVLYRMISICHSFELLKKETDERLEAYALKLGKKKVDALSSPFARRKTQFWIWFSVTVIIYISVIFLIIYIGRVLPEYLTQFGTVSPQTSPIINSTLNAVNTT